MGNAQISWARWGGRILGYGILGSGFLVIRFRYFWFRALGVWVVWFLVFGFSGFCVCCFGFLVFGLDLVLICDLIVT